MIKLTNILKELNIFNYLGQWVDTASLKKKENFPESIFLYLKKKGYISKGEIYRVLNMDPLIVIIKQNTEYIDLIRFLNDSQNLGDDIKELYFLYKHEQEVIARLDPNFTFELIYHVDTSGSNLNMNSYYEKQINTNRFKSKLKNEILKKDQKKLVSFSKNKEAAMKIFDSIEGNLDIKYEDEENEDNYL